MFHPGLISLLGATLQYELSSIRRVQFAALTIQDEGHIEFISYYGQEDDPYQLLVNSKYFI